MKKNYTRFALKNYLKKILFSFFLVFYVITIGAQSLPIAYDTTIYATENSVDTELNIVAPSDMDADALTITVTGLPAAGTITLSNGTAVTNGQTLTIAELTSLQYDAPASIVNPGDFTYNVTDKDGTTSGLVNIIITEDDFDGIAITVTDPNSPSISVPAAITISGCDENSILATSEDILDATIKTHYVYSSTLVTVLTNPTPAEIVTFNNLVGYSIADASENIVSLTYIDVVTQTTCPIKVTRTWTITDSCNPLVTTTQEINIKRTIPPTEQGGPVAIASEVECFDDAVAPVLPVMQDVCGNVIAAPLPVVTGTATDNTACDGDTVIYTYTYVDGCDNTLTTDWVYTYTLNRLTDPVEVGGPVAIASEVECFDDAVAPVLPVMQDVCGNVIAAPLPVVTGTATDNTACDGDTVIYTYTYVDGCDNTLTTDWVYTYTLNRLTDPVEVGGPVAIASEVECFDDAVAPVLPVMHDVCGNVIAAPLPVVTGTATDNTACDGDTVIYTYTYVDGCDNTLTTDWVYTYTLNRLTDPAIVCPSDQTRVIDQNETTYSTVGTEFDYTSLTYTCNTPSVINNLNGLNTLDGFVFPLGDTIVTWTSTDDCNNVTECSFTVSVLKGDIEILKEGEINDVNGDGIFGNLGDSITYNFTVANTGNLTLTDVEITDPLLGSAPILVTPSTLMLGDIGTASADYMITQADIDAGEVTNQATVRGEAPGGDPNDPTDDVTDTSDDPADPTDNDNNGDGEPDDITIIVINNPNDDDDCIIIIYNEFSPNNDGVNDYFVIDCLDNYPDNTLEVYNRWGNLVYKVKNYKNDWNGTSNGRFVVNESDKLPVGTYYYVINLGDGSKPKVGWLYINM
ncbi:gliding motility-associated C-terminal domain-containing protein [Sabulilitoribacter arenilitoris]|uniref:Gliding motility-associated C-terminal domain-containing protein n=1 Tax=Wocania arenilitoris TaxID=2044858 RepID=A0AAE3JMS8_9FLAO|nr:gliding motility-associated C-terminal domain-containing protein [Wocania arenilitoris]MCF7569632.1 gliding motility-associated C-terminal domain-containing protein [Wocania arenilitoris]